MLKNTQNTNTKYKQREVTIRNQTMFFRSIVDSALAKYSACAGGGGRVRDHAGVRESTSLRVLAHRVRSAASLPAPSVESHVDQ